MFTRKMKSKPSGPLTSQETRTMETGTETDQNSKAISNRYSNKDNNKNTPKTKKSQTWGNLTQTQLPGALGPPSSLPGLSPAALKPQTWMSPLTSPFPTSQPRVPWNLPSEPLPSPTPAAEVHSAELVADAEPPLSVIWAGRDQPPTSPQAPL